MSSKMDTRDQEIDWRILRLEVAWSSVLLVAASAGGRLLFMTVIMMSHGLANHWHSCQPELVS